MQSPSEEVFDAEAAIQDLRLEIEEKIRTERAEREISLISQDHRMIPSIVELAKSVLDEKIENRKRRIVASIASIFWCVLPSPATSAVGIVAVASLFMAWQQTRLLSAQNQKIDIQNILSEAQRRSGLYFEVSAISDIINQEKVTARPNCDFATSDTVKSDACWRLEKDGVRLFRPSAATIGRIAALTQAFRPYRYLSVEDAAPYRFVGLNSKIGLCSESIVSENLMGLGEVMARLSAEESSTDVAEIMSNVNNEISDFIHRKYGAYIPSHFSNYLSYSESKEMVSNFMEFVTFTDGESSNFSLNCAPGSPERGQMLTFLHAANVDISSITARGGDFRYADAPAAYLTGIHLTDVDLSNARLPGANFSGAHLEGVSFANAFLSGAVFLDSDMSNVDFRGSITQKNNDAGASAGPISAKSAENVSLQGMKIVEFDAKENLGLRMCVMVELVSRLIKGKGTGKVPTEPSYIPMMGELEQYGILSEEIIYTANHDEENAKYGDSLSVIVKKFGNKEVKIFEKPIGRNYRLEINYWPFSHCEWPVN